MAHVRERIERTMAPELSSVTRRKLLQSAAAGVGTLLLASCAPAQAPGGAATPGAAATATVAKKGGTLRVANTGDLVALDPHSTVLDVFTQTMRTSVFDRLTTFDKGQPVPMLATAWSFTNPKTLEVNLRSGVKFHNGKNFGADDVKFTIERIKDPKTASPFIAHVRNIASVEVVDPLKVRINLTVPTPNLPTSLGLLDIVTSQGIEDVLKNPVGTGPFKFVEWLPSDHATLARFDGYWRQGLPHLDELRITPIVDANTRATNVLAGSSDLMIFLDYKDAARIESGGGRVVSSPPADSYVVMQFNTVDGPMKDKRVRQAMAYALDRESYVKELLLGNGKASAGPFSPSNPFYDPVLDTTYQFNLDKAKALLAEAGYPGGQGLNIRINTTAFPPMQSGGTVLQSTLKQIGVNANLQLMDQAAWIDAIRGGKFDINMNGYSWGSVDPAIAFGTNNLDPTSNNSRYANPTYADLVVKGTSTTDQNERKQIYAQLQKILADDVPMSVVAFRSTLWGMSGKVHDFAPNAVNYIPWETVWMG